ncbi:thiamine phosphate synthase [Mycoavidus cysteinexigens]|uniref:thiamine phosphate synthase n=1 Tax=Mycoavidus cysteinexigens TaxID=1553431 RepID=UPI0005EE9DE4|nr:thiamine phosphate synthase [Mycoavidus cysteinexigens]GAM52101.1 thiamin-phosphate pyrophosphorylase [bacterium endosymbiont of Mortierella elongata FMR23-6]
MNRSISPHTVAGQTTFWPLDNALRATATRIRARLGQWPSPSIPWRLCRAVPSSIEAHDLIILYSTTDAAQAESSYFSAAAGVLTVADKTISLQCGDKIYSLAGARSNDWLAAFAAFLDCNFMPHDALVLAHAWRTDNLAANDAWPVDYDSFPRVVGLDHLRSNTPFAPCPWQLGLYPVVPNADWVERLLDLGVTTLQLRAKNLEHAMLQAEIKRAVQAARQHNAQLFINDHWQLAIEANAYGVHLGQEDLCTANLQTIANAGLRLGLSTHGYYEMLVAYHFQPSYIAIGAVFPTTTKVMPTTPQGLSRLARYVQLLKEKVPLVAIGGIDHAVLADVLATGVGSAAVVRAVTEASDLREAVVALQQGFAPNAGLGK